MAQRTGGRVLGLRFVLIASMLAATVGLAMPAPAEAAVTCTGPIVGETIRSNLVVPDGVFCFLLVSVVRGDVLVEAGGNLRAEGTEIRGSIKATGHNEFLVDDGVVRGSIFAEGGTGYTALSEPDVRGDVTLVNNGGDDVAVGGSKIRGSLTVNHNTAAIIAISNNSISRDLSCTGNVPAPTLLGNPPNRVGGSTSGQCAGL